MSEKQIHTGALFPFAEHIRLCFSEQGGLPKEEEEEEKEKEEREREGRQTDRLAERRGREGQGGHLQSSSEHSCMNERTDSRPICLASLPGSFQGAQVPSVRNYTSERF